MMTRRAQVRSGRLAALLDGLRDEPALQVRGLQIEQSSSLAVTIRLFGRVQGYWSWSGSAYVWRDPAGPHVLHTSYTPDDAARFMTQSLRFPCGLSLSA